MELRWILAAWALPSILGETWNVVDISQVVCEKPDFPGAPAFPATYSMTFNHEVLSLNDPYIVSFMRATDSAMTIKFKMEDANGEQVIPATCR
ncbi:unnamed protein product [Durusdinium trenchii]|uniref:Uncharacterized protein n=1 Tax=Durusdinium trenchii TaxID=1381693 RepID=A0ABP0HM09_9DINO